MLAKVYGATIDSLIKTEKADAFGMIPPALKGKSLRSSVTVNS